jgi:myosin heavy subunit
MLAAKDTDPVLKEIMPSDMTASDFNYLNPKELTIPGVDDAKEWVETCAALDKLVSTDERQQVIHVLTGILFLGNITVRDFVIFLLHMYVCM